MLGPRGRNRPPPPRLVGYFGERFDGGCGHCTFCRTGTAVRLPEPRSRPTSPDAARFLCGLTSPALTAARLTRHELFGCLGTADFREVLAWARAFGAHQS